MFGGKQPHPSALANFNPTRESHGLTDPSPCIQLSKLPRMTPQLHLFVALSSFLRTRTFAVRRTLTLKTPEHMYVPRLNHPAAGISILLEAFLGRELPHVGSIQTLNARSISYRSGGAARVSHRHGGHGALKRRGPTDVWHWTLITGGVRGHVVTPVQRRKFVRVQGKR